MPKRPSVPESPVEPPSRSQLKRDATALQQLGEALARLTPNVWDGLPLSPALREALGELRRASTHEARRRQMQFIGRIMREDADVPAIREAIDRLSSAHAADSQRFQHIEVLRQTLLEAEPDALAELLAPYGDEAPALRVLIAQARDEKAQGRPPRAFRSLFRKLASLA